MKNDNELTKSFLKSYIIIFSSTPFELLSSSSSKSSSSLESIISLFKFKDNSLLKSCRSFRGLCGLIKNLNLNHHY